MREEEEGSMTTRSSLLKILSSYNSNVLLAALLFLLLVVLFVLLLHFYARFYWSSSDQEFLAARLHRRRRRRRIRRRTVTTTRIIPPVPLGGVDGEASVAATASDDKGLDSWVISSIPLFVYEEDEEEKEEEEECVICLGLWEAGDFGRKLRFCGHGFHVECIDMWLSSHSSCPLCRSPVLAVVSDQENLKLVVNDDVDGVVQEEEEEAEVRIQLFPSGGDENVVAGDRRFSLSLDVMEDNAKTGVSDGDGVGEVRIEVLDEEINGGGSRGDRRSTSSASSSLMRMLSSSRSRSECSKVFPSSAATQDSSQ